MDDLKNAGWDYQVVLEYLHRKTRWPLYEHESSIKYDKLLIVSHVWHLECNSSPLLSNPIVITKYGVSVEDYVENYIGECHELIKGKFAENTIKILDVVIEKYNVNFSTLWHNVSLFCQRDRCLKENIRVVPDSYMNEGVREWLKLQKKSS